MALTMEVIDDAVARYLREYDRYHKMAEVTATIVRQILDDHALRGTVQWRAKNPERLKKKLIKYMDNNEHGIELSSVDGVFGKIKDFSGVRVLTYVESDRVKVVDKILEYFRGVGSETVVPDIKAHGFYRATHCQVRLTDQYCVDTNFNLRDVSCEIQVCSLLAHVFNEVEHDIRYKPLSGEISPAENSLLDAMGHLAESGDIIINQLLDMTSARQSKEDGKFADEYDFVVKMNSIFPSASNFSEYSGQVYSICVNDLNLNTLSKVKQAINYNEQSSYSEALDLVARVGGKLTEQDISTKVNGSTSDILLVLLLKNSEFCELLKRKYPSGRGISRAKRFMVIAKRVEEVLLPDNIL